MLKQGSAILGGGLKSAQGAQFAPSFLSSRFYMVLWHLQVLFFVLHRLEAGNGAPCPTGVSARVRVRGRSSVRVSVHPFICPSTKHARTHARMNRSLAGLDAGTSDLP